MIDAIASAIVIGLLVAVAVFGLWQEYKRQSRDPFRPIERPDDWWPPRERHPR